jgi:hypothetical protein
MRPNPLTVVALATLLGACGDLTTEPDVATVPPPSLSFDQGPSELPNILRAGGFIVSAFVDFETDLALFVGAPDDPSSDRVCGGAGQRQFTPAQWVGDFEEVLKQLAINDEINIVVYSPIPPTAIEALCATEPFATGTGRFLRTDNDFFGFAGRANAVTEHVHGTVALEDGELARLSARFQALGAPDGTLRWIDTTIQLRAIGASE